MNNEKENGERAAFLMKKFGLEATWKNGLATDKSFDISIFLAKYGVPVLERKRLVLITLIVCLVISIAMTFLVRPEYTTYADFLIEEPRSKKIERRDIRTQTEVVPKRAKRDYVYAEAEKLKSSRIAIKVFEQLPEVVREDLRIGLDLGVQIIAGIEGLLTSTGGDELEGEGPGSPSDCQDNVGLLAEMNERLRVDTKIDRAIIRVSVRNVDKKAGPPLLNAYTDVWMASNLEDNRREISAKTAFAEGQKDNAYEAYKKAENDMINFRRRFQLPAEITALRDVELQLEMRRIDTALEMAKNRFHILEQIYLEANVQKAGVIGNIAVMGPPVVIFSPSRFSGRKLIYYGITAGLILGIAIVLLLDYFRGPTRHESDITGTIRIPILGHIPRI
ncbi:MAG: Wzz/FepE/Etk N-terminal domain-containing protein [Thermodesulfobacteriota bacterium]|nr:Wzz/FepE/Etk N-terminal domain-containing protein [Thermodesulfobacteriota bacterium]